MSTTAEPDIHPAPVPAEKVRRLIEGSVYLHVDLAPDAGAADCPNRGERIDDEWIGDGRCSNPDHYHAWLRIPNQFQRNEVREKALAARARRKRLIETPGTDAYEIFESGLADVRRAVEEGGANIVKDELLGVHRMTDQIDAYQTVTAREEWEHIGDDRARLAELEEQIAETGVEPDDELVMLRDRCMRYLEQVNAEEAALREPREIEIDTFSAEQLMQRVRDVRLESETLSEFIHAESWNEWLLGTHETTRNAKGHHRTRKYPTAEALHEEAPEVLDELQIAFADLKEPIAVRAEGNS